MSNTSNTVGLGEPDIWSYTFALIIIIIIWYISSYCCKQNHRLNEFWKAKDNYNLSRQKYADALNCILKIKNDIAYIKSRSSIDKYAINILTEDLDFMRTKRDQLREDINIYSHEITYITWKMNTQQ